MKNTILSLLILFLSAITMFGQCNDFYRQTLNGSNIKACPNGNHEDWQIQEADYYSRAYAIEVLGNSTDSYNCHSYAWHMSEGGDEVWINNVQYEAGNLNSYWLDGSYIELAGRPSYAGAKVFYGSNNFFDYNDDHSAITTSDPNVFISKMSCGVLCSYPADCDAYDNSDLKYYEPFKINATQTVCSGNTAAFTTPDYVNCNFNWTYHTGLLKPVSGQGTNNFVVEPKASYSSGLAWVKLTLSIDPPVDTVYTVTKNIRVGPPDPTPDPEDISIEGGYLSYPSPFPCIYSYGPQYGVHREGHIDGADTYSWDGMVLGNLTGTSAGVYFYPVPEGPPYYGSGYILLTGTNSCGSTTIGTGYGSCGYMMVVMPNPATDEAILSIESSSAEKTLDEDIEWEFEVFTDRQMLKQKETRIQSKTATLRTAGWKDGVYIIRAVCNGEVIHAKLVVKH